MAETENVSRAALRLHVSQPALSRQIRDLEDDLGFALLRRTAKSVALTDAGRGFLVEARAVLERVTEAVQTARAIATGQRGELHVGYAPSPTVRILPPALRAFQAGRPEVRVKLHDLSTEEMIAGLREKRLQIAFLVQPTRAMLRGLRFEGLERDPLCLAVPPGHPIARLRSVPLARAAAEPFVALARREYPEYHEHLASVFAALKTVPRVVAEHDSSTSLVAAVEAGCGVALVPQSLACSAGSRVKILPFAPAPPPLVIGAAWPREEPAPLAGQFLQSARQVVEKARRDPRQAGA